MPVPQATVMSSYFTPPMCLCTIRSGPIFSLTTSAVAWPPSADEIQPAEMPSTSSANLPATYARVAIALPPSNKEKAPPAEPGEPDQDQLLFHAAAGRHLADAEDDEF